jgi:tellurite resistance protein/uncharacterized protein (DUF697 family)
MTMQEREAVLTIALLAAFADGGADPREREMLKRITDAMQAEGIDGARLYQDVLNRRRTVAQASAVLGSPEARQEAYEAAVCVCDADGARGTAESAFLSDLRDRLGLSADAARQIETDAARLAAQPLALSEVEPSATPGNASGAELDSMIVNYAVLNGALELLPQKLAGMAIIPMQMRMVYRIGKAHGFELDSGHIKDFLATLGVGLASQYVEQFGRKLMSGLLGKLAGGVGRTIGNVGTGFAFSFATTYALGHIAKRYYAGGRSLSTEALKAGFNGLLGEARELQGRYLPQIEARAKTLNLSEVLASVRR